MENANAAEPHAQDAVGARNVDAESNRPRLTGRNEPQQQEDQQRERRVRRRTQTTTTATSAVTVMLMCLSEAMFVPIPTNELNQFIPSSIMMYVVLNEMDEIMTSNRYWFTRSQIWSPMVSRIYVGMLFYMQILKCMRHVGRITSGLRNLLRMFEETYSPEVLVIPGPLVPFFKSLTVCKTPHNEYGYVSPVIPYECGASANRAHLLHDDLFCLLPNMTGMYRAVRNMRRVLGQNALPWDHDLGDDTTPANAPVPRRHNAGNHQAANAAIAPGTIHQLPWDQRTRNQWQRYPERIKVPTIPNIGVNWGGFLGLSNGIEWFGEIVKMMTHYAKFWEGNSSMQAMSAVDGCAPLALVQLTDVYRNRDTHRNGDQLQVPTTGEVTLPWIPDDELGIRTGMFTQINVILPPNYGPNDNIGAIGVTRSGPWWQVAPERARSLTYNPAPMVGPIIAQHLSNERPK